MTNEEQTRFADEELRKASEWLADSIIAERRENGKTARAYRIGAKGRIKEALAALERMEEK